MIRVLHVLEAVRGGTSRHVSDVVRAAPNVAHHVVIPRSLDPDPNSGAPVDTAATLEMVAHGAVIHRIDMRRSTVHPANPLAALRLAALCRRLQPTLLHGHSSVGGALARIAGRLTGLPVVYTPNALATGPVVVRIERALGRRTHTLVAVSESEAALARQLNLLPRDRIRVIPNGIDLEPPTAEGLDLRERIGLAPDARLIGTVARLVPQKAPEDFVAVCAALARTHPEVHALLIGLGPQQALVDETVDRLGVRDRFHQIEYLPNAAAYLDQLDVFVLPSRFEGAPYTPLEAIRAEVPVVLSDVVGNHDVVEDGVSGYLRAVGDVDGMAAAVARLLDRSGDRRAFVDAASRRLQKEFDLANMGADLTDLYRSVTGASL